MDFDWHRWPPFGGYVALKTKPRAVAKRVRPRRSLIRWHSWAPFGGYVEFDWANVSDVRREAEPAEIHAESPPVSATISHPRDLIADVLAGHVDPRTLTLHEERIIKRWCREVTRSSEVGISSLVARGNSRNAKRARLTHLNRREVMLHALFIAARRRWPIRLDMSAAAMESIRKRRLVAVFDNLDRVRRFAQPARGRSKLLQKTGGGTRPVIDFDWISRARQIALKSGFTPFANLHGTQFMLARDPERRGPAAVRKALLAALGECSVDSVFMQFDIRDFHGSISHRWLEGHLGIDPLIVRRQIHLAEMRIVPIGETMVVRGPHEASKVEKARWGIPQGSSLSSLIAEMVMASVARSVAAFAELPTFIWSDNLGIIVPQNRAREIESLVHEAFAQHGAGPFHINRVHAGTVTTEFKFNGVWYRRTASGAKAYISTAVASNWAVATGNRISHAGLAELAVIQRYIRDKLAQWSWWPAAYELEVEMNALIASARAAILNRWRP